MPYMGRSVKQVKVGDLNHVIPAGANSICFRFMNLPFLFYDYFVNNLLKNL